eukprot:scaffold1637_cov118-Skeletonema_dohrnii-CCMP3373.AAC.2
MTAKQPKLNATNAHIPTGGMHWCLGLGLGLGGWASGQDEDEDFRLRKENIISDNQCIVTEGTSSSTC